MTPKTPRKTEEEFNKKLIKEYLKYGSVDRVFKKHRYSLPISYPSYQRLLDRWGIVKAAGPNNLFSEILSFMACYTSEGEKATVERVYRKMPPTFKTSLSTLHRILGLMKEGVVRRSGTALVINLEGKKNMVLVAKDMSLPKHGAVRNIGDMSLPMGFSAPGENPKRSILRVLQQEVFAELAVDKKLPESIIPRSPSPFMRLQIADVDVSAYEITMPARYQNSFSSYKLKDHQFIDTDSIIELGDLFRPGVVEIVEAFGKQGMVSAKLQKTVIADVNLQLVPAFVEQ